MPNLGELKAYQKESAEGRRRPEDEEMRNLRVTNLRTLNELAADRLTRSGQLTAPQYLAISKEAIEEARVAERLEEVERPAEEIYPEILQKKLAEIQAATGVGGGSGKVEPERKKMPDGSEWEKTAAGWKRIK